MSSPEVSKQLVFKSRAHPGDISPSYLYLQALVQPLIWCMIPVMIGAATSVLLEYDPLGFLIFGMPAASTAAIGWTLFYLTQTVVQIRIMDGHAAIYSSWDVTQGTAPATGPLLHAERTRFGLRTSVGDTVYTLRAENWPEFEELLAALRQHVQ